VRRLDAGERIGCVLEAPDATWAVLLRKDSQRSADMVKFTIPGPHPAHVLLTDLAPGTWHVRCAGTGVTRGVEVSAESGAAWFEGAAGTWSLTR
jgi:hypothetical protein